MSSTAGPARACIGPAQTSPLPVLSDLAWVTAFGGFAVLCGPALLRAKPEA